MPLAKKPLEPSEFPRFFDLVSICFAHDHPYIDAVFPSHETPAGRAEGAQRFKQMMETDPNTSFWKVVDTDITPDGKSSEIIAVAKWNVYQNTVPKAEPLGGDWWKEDTEGGGESENERLAYAQALFDGYLQERRTAIQESGGNLVSLDILVTDPKHQYRGAGTMLVKHGTEIADRMDVETVVESSVFGRHLYEKEGFENRKFITLEVPEKWALRPKQRFFWMVRPRKE